MNLPKGIVDTAVLMCTHNDEATLSRAINSIAASTIPVHLYIVDDGSRIPIANELAGLAFCIIRLEHNVGLTKALNIGLKAILDGNYRYVARMDSDDFSYPRRLEIQRNFLDAHAGTSGVGTWANYIDADTGHNIFINSPPVDAREIRRSLNSNNCMLHPTWMMRRDVFLSTGGYNENFSVAQDFEFVRRADSMGFEFSNLPEPLLDYYVSSTSISSKKRNRQLISRLKIQIMYFKPHSISAWFGVGKSAALLCLPNSIVRMLKKRRVLSR
jgi:glycosyltransferase involved in cell wall biosynthesis